MSFSWEIKTKGFGPFATQSTGTIKRDQPRACAKVAIYSANGQGKTCLSRLFRAAEVGVDALNDSNITQGQNVGAFEFRTRDSSGDSASETTLHIDKRRGALATINDNTGLLFHVFNSDYVKLNLEAVSYSPSGQIDGYIVGKDNIDVSDKKKSLSNLFEEGKGKRDEIVAAIEQGQASLVDLGVSRATNEFKSMTVEEICSLPVSSNDYDEKVAEYVVLRDLPDNLEQLNALEFQPPHIDYASFHQTLTTPYSRASFTDEFLADVSSKIGFVTEGMRLTGDGNECPFCGQEYKDDARKLLHMYGEYLDGQEARIINSLISMETTLDALRSAYVQLMSAHVTLVREYDRRKMGFADFKESMLSDLPAIEVLDELIRQVKAVIGEKRQDITRTFDDVPVSILSDFLDGVSREVTAVNEKVSGINAATQRTRRLKTDLRKALCIEMSRKIRLEQDNAIRQRSDIAKRYSALRAEIQADEAHSRRPKRDAVAETFELLLRRMFGEKYTFDRERFSILFGQNALDTEAEQILSDGEKSVVAFCYYIASTYELFDDEDDRQRIFFIIDDPISSLDYHCVYSVAQTIKNLGTLFGMANKNQRFLVMTHNSAFFNMLCRNKIVEASYALHDGCYKQVKHNGITHYDMHLRDINAVYQGGAATHTTGNSIRQIIEGIWHFDDPTVDNLASYLSMPQCSDLASCDYIYLLCNDESHGAAATELDPPIDEDGMRRACAAVLRHINRRFPGQLKASGIVFDESADAATN